MELNWRLVCLTEEQGANICTWNYPPPYDIYNWPSWKHMVTYGLEFADPEVRAEQYVAIVDDSEQLCGFAQLFPITGVTRLGLGLRPDLIGHGLGSSLVNLLIREAKERAPHHVIDLEVFTWNLRAQRSYLKAGFTITDTYVRETSKGLAAFYCMVYDDTSN